MLHQVSVFKLVVRDDLSLANYSSQPELQLECSHSGNILTLCLKAYDVSAQIYYFIVYSAVLLHIHTYIYIRTLCCWETWSAVSQCCSTVLARSLKSQETTTLTTCGTSSLTHKSREYLRSYIHTYIYTALWASWVHQRIIFSVATITETYFHCEEMPSQPLEKSAVSWKVCVYVCAYGI